MQNPVGMRFDPAQMRNVMDNFWEVAFNAVPVNKFFHAVFSGWCLAGVFVVGVSCWLLWRKRNVEAAKSSLKVGSWVGMAGILLTLATGHGSAVEVARVQPMKLAAMEGLYRGEIGQSIIGIGILKPENERTPDDPMLFSVDIPQGLSYLIYGEGDHFVPGICDLIDGFSINENGDTVNTVSYAERIAAGTRSREALARYGAAVQAGDTQAAELAGSEVEKDFKYFGYSYLSSPEDAIPPVGMTFYSFHIMVFAGGFLLLLFAVMLFLSYRKTKYLEKAWLNWIGIASIAIVWICSQAGWIVAEVGRQPWVIQDLMPTTAAISDISASSVKITFWIFAAIFTGLLIAEISIMLRYISSASKGDIENPTH